MSNRRTFLDMLVARRTNFALRADAAICNRRIEEVVTVALRHVPSPFNTQTSRIILLLGRDHKKLWDITMEVILPRLEGSQLEASKLKLDNFKRAHGTVSAFQPQWIHADSGLIT